MRNGVNAISEGIFEINERREFFLNLRKKNSKILQYCNYLLLKEKEKEYKKQILEKLKVQHKKLCFNPLLTKSIKINTNREYFNKKTILDKKTFSNRNKSKKIINYSNSNQNLTLQKIRYNSANIKMIDKNKTMKNNKSFNNKRLILIPLKLKTYIKNKEIEDNKIAKRKKYNKKLIFKNNNPFYNPDLFSPKMKENDMTFPKRFQKFKKDLTEETFRAKDMLIKFEDLIMNEK